MSSKPPSTAPPASTPPGTQIPRTLLVIVIALIIVVVAFGIVPFLESAFNPAPNITLVNKIPSSSGCGTGGGSLNYYTYSWTFDLKNNGNTNANATIGIYDLGASYSTALPLTTQVYNVPKASIVHETFSYDFSAAGCTAHSLDLKVQSTIAT